MSVISLFLNLLNVVELVVFQDFPITALAAVIRFNAT